MAYTITFKLRQHTPLIHFQHEQQGATLRSTEVKSKLDQFIWEKQWENDFNKGKKFLVGYSPGKSEDLQKRFKNEKFRALDYQITIRDLDPSPQTGNTSIITRDDIGYWIKSASGLTVNIFSLEEELLNIIEKHYRGFFAITNFGKRQSKGWGSYYCMENEGDFETQLRDSDKHYFKYNHILPQNATSDQFYETIKDTWRLLKSGINHRMYKKAKIFEYAASKNLRWDKRLLKKDLNQLIGKRELRFALRADMQPMDLSHNGEEYNNWKDNAEFDGHYRFFRAMLGLPELYEFQADGGNLHQVTFKHDENDKEKVIDRFKSPVTFKVIGSQIYAIVEEIDPKYFSQTFSAMVKTKGKNERGAGMEPIQMPSKYITPDKIEFDLLKFLTKYMSQIGFTLIK